MTGTTILRRCECQAARENERPCGYELEQDPKGAARFIRVLRASQRVHHAAQAIVSANVGTIPSKVMPPVDSAPRVHKKKRLRPGD